MRYSYRIATRQSDVVDQGEYAGIVTADTSKLALVAALAYEFGDELPDVSNWFARLTDSGRIDPKVLMDMFDKLEDSDTSCCLYSVNNTFVVQVEEVEEGVGINFISRKFTISVAITMGEEGELAEDFLDYEGDFTLGGEGELVEDFMANSKIDFTVSSGVTDGDLVKLVRVVAVGVRNQVLAGMWPKLVVSAKVCF